MAELFIALLVVLAIVLLAACAVAIPIYSRAPVERLRRTHTFRPLAAPEPFRLTAGLSVSELDLDHLPGAAVIAFLLHEDDLFFCHRGFNWPEMRTRISVFLTGQGRLRGGSSITQQLAKNAFELTFRYRRKPWRRKMAEALIAAKIERTLSKTEILTLYLEILRFGLDNLHGLPQAARYYFAKEAQSLTLSEVMFLAGIIPSPLTWVEEILSSRNTSAFRYRNAYFKFIDLYRILLLAWGWDAVETPRSISAREAIEFMSSYRSYNPHRLPSEAEFALNIRALRAVEDLRTLIEDLALNGPRSARNAAAPEVPYDKTTTAP